MLIALFDMDQTEVQPAVLMILIFTAVSGYLRPDLAYLWALILGLSFFLVNLIADLKGYKLREPIEPNVFATLIALVPAFIGAYAGVLFKWIYKRIDKKINRHKL